MQSFLSHAESRNQPCFYFLGGWERTSLELTVWTKLTWNSRDPPASRALEKMPGPPLPSSTPVTLAFLFLLGEAFLSSSAWHAKRESFGQLRTRRRRCWAMVPHPAVQTKAGHLQSARLSGGRQERCFLSFSPSWMHSQSISVAHALQTRALCRGRSSQTCP